MQRAMERVNQASRYADPKA